MKVSVDYKKHFENTYISFYSRMSRFAQSYVIYEEDAENIVQDIFIDIWEKKIDLYAISNVSGYLFLTLKNKCIDYIRRKRSESQAITEIQKEREISLKLKFDSLEALDNKLLTDPSIDTLIEQAINNLPEKCRQIFVMNKFDGKKQRIIANELNISIHTVESQMSIAYKKLKEELKEYFPIFIYFI
jgi:RNA polymerase sigma-70 factor (ECF subfamily)